MSYLANNDHESERARIAHSLHDDTIQSLVAIAQGIDLGRHWYDTDPLRASAMLKTTHQYTVDTIEALRNLIADLIPPVLEDLGLVAAIKGLAHKSSDLTISVSVEGPERRLRSVYELTLFRCVQEALAGIRGHKQATRIDIEVIFLKDEICLIISDNGCGPISSDYIEDVVANSQYGFLSIQQRVQLLNGQFQLSSQSDTGTTVKVSIPIAQQPQPLHAVRDPVCKKLIMPNQAYSSMDYQGQHYYFCCPVCKKEFQRTPETYLLATT